jgi:epoxyqueuosine reductase
LGADKKSGPAFTDRTKALREELPQSGARFHHPSGQLPPREGALPQSLTSELRSRAYGLGFVRFGVIPLDVEGGLELPRAAFFERWLARGYAGEMISYLGPEGARAERARPGTLLDGARSLIVVALAHEPHLRSTPAGPSEGANAALGTFLARYARGTDYHHAIKDRLLYLADILADLVGRPILARGVVDTAPLLERDAAELAGLGFIGKNTLLIAPGQGSGILLGSLVTDVELSSLREPELRVVQEGCGTCRACLDACPTGAFSEEYVLDARRCISYLTIELVGPIPRELRALIGVRVFGCDACQTVCPFNQTKRAEPAAPDLTTKPIWNARTLVDLLFLGSAQYRALVRGTALRRTFRVQLSRNAAVALGNSGDPAAVAPLFQAAQEHPFELVREHATWALGELAFHHRLAEARTCLERLKKSPLAAVRDEAERWWNEAAEAP